MQPDRISILTDIDGVCDVVFYEGREQIHLAKNTEDCMGEYADIEETMIRLTEEAPLVGFHGMADFEGLVSLGLILLDNLDPVC